MAQGFLGFRMLVGGLRLQNLWFRLDEAPPQNKTKRFLGLGVQDVTVLFAVWDMQKPILMIKAPILPLETLASLFARTGDMNYTDEHNLTLGVPSRHACCRLPEAPNG